MSVDVPAHADLASKLSFDLNAGVRKRQDGRESVFLPYHEREVPQRDCKMLLALPLRHNDRNNLVVRG